MKNTEKNKHVLINDMTTRKRLIDAFSFIPKKRTRYFIEHKKGCNCKECIKKWVAEDTYYGKIEAYEVNLPEGKAILFINKNIKETSKIDV